MEKARKERLSQILRDAMNRLGLSQQQLSEVLGVGYYAVNSWLHARSTPTHENMIKIANFLAKDLDSFNKELAGEETEMPTVQVAEDVVSAVFRLSSYEQIRLLRMVAERIEQESKKKNN